MCNARAAGLTLLFAAVSVLSTAAHGAPPIKFVDDHGLVHYGDRASAEALARANIARESKPTVALPASLAKSSEGVLSAAEQQRKDRVLLDSYSSAGEIDRARERVTSSIQAEIDAARRNVEKLKIRRSELDSVKPGTVAAGPSAESVQVTELLTQELRFIALKTDQFEKASARYDADKRRWQEINGEVASR